MAWYGELSSVAADVDGVPAGSALLMRSPGVPPSDYDDDPVWSGGHSLLMVLVWSVREELSYWWSRYWTLRSSAGSAGVGSLVRSAGGPEEMTVVDTWSVPPTFGAAHSVDVAGM